MSQDQIAASAGRKAKAELEQTSDAFAKLKAAATEKLIGCPPEKEATILKLHMVLHILNAVEAALMECAVNGQVAEQALAIADLTRP